MKTDEEKMELKDLPGVAQKLLAAVDREITTEFFPRVALNTISPSFPWHHRTIANRMSRGTGPRESILVGKKRFISKVSLLEMLADDLRTGTAK